jgi:hypothetical protein
MIDSGGKMPVKEWARRHPRLAMWAVLAVGMVGILIWSAWDVGLLSGQWAAMIAAVILLAGLCAWIIGWEDEKETGEEST